MKKVILLGMMLVLVAVLVFPAAAQEETPPTIGQLVSDRAASEDAPQFTILLEALKVADQRFIERLSDPDMVAATFTTVFAPTDDAFTALLEEMQMTPEDLLANPDLVNEVLAYHILPGIFAAENFAARETALYGTFVPHTALTITSDGETIQVNDATVVEADIPALNGMVHVIDKVLLPASLDDETALMVDEELPTIYEILQSREDFSYFLELMDMMGFQTDLMVTNYTLFLPTNDVLDAFFTQVGVTKEDLFANTDTITPVAFYHFLSGTFTAEDLMLMSEEGELVFGTQQPGTFMTITVDGETVKADAAAVTEADIMAKNGVIHVIDTVLLPSGS
ncbi:MAG: fasciclin domain-containing protein [Anaerolineae bacterium]|nr:fasciclin domain-containing protein [Anaerolineae bacterium]